ncbi:MAG: fibronectin type III domain-containing protein [Prevotellaceae bacterium]|nr:fibronectin type III domain-containing protein [Prevotellaceae bacterium]
MKTRKKRNVLSCILLAGAMAIGLQPLSAKVWYVGTAWQGKAPDDVKTTIAEAVSAAASGDSVWVAAGDCPITVAITLKEGVSLYGGFAGTEASVEERVKVTNGQPWEFVNVTKVTSEITNVFTTTANIPIATNTTIDGFTVEGHTATVSASAGSYAIYHNNASGGIIVRNTIIQNTCQNATGNNDHGGIGFKGPDCLVEYCLIQNNKGKNGGGAYVERGTLRNSVIRNNRTVTTSTTSAGNASPAGNGGGVFLITGGKVYNCLIEGNEASFGGGAFMGNENASLFYNNVVIGNTAKNGGAISYDNRNTGTGGLVYNVTIANNASTEVDGGGIYFTVNGRVYNAILYGNKDGADAVKNVAVVGGKTPVLKNNISDADLNDGSSTGNVIATDSAALFAENWVSAAASPGRDAGTVDGITTVPATDYAGKIRVKGVAIDIGPYEFPEPPAVPADLKLIPTEATIVVQWTASTSSVSGYNVYCNSVKQNTDLIAVATYTVTGLTPGTQYSIGVEAIDADGIASLRVNENTSTLTSGDTEAPSQPGNLTQVAVTKTTITVRYDVATDNVGVIGYRIYANGTAKGATDQLRYTITGLTPGTAYAIEVKAYDASDNESTSSTLNLTTLAANQPTVFYVKPGSGSTLWGSKPSYFVKNTINEAIAALKGLHEIGEVWVGAGDYLNISLALVDSISLYGGFAGTESAVGERAKGSDPWSFTNATVLNGETPAYNSSNTNNINSKSVIKQDITASHPLVVDGFTLTNGEHGLLLLGGGNTTVRRCIIRGNGQLPSGVVGIDGGGAAIRGTGKYRVSYCLIENNSGKSGGGVMIAEASANAVVEYCTIRNNKALTVNTGVWDFENNNNSIHGWGGGVFNQNGVVNSCLISGNEALAGGGILVRANASRFNSCIVEGNSAIFGGGITYDKRASNAATSKNVYNCLFANNKVSQKPGYATAGTSPAAEKGLGGGVCFIYEGQTIYNSIFINNINADSALSVAGNAGVAGKLTSSYVDVEADTAEGNFYHPAAEDLYEAGTWKPKDGFPGVDYGAPGNTEVRDYEGKIRVKGSAIDIGPYEKPGIPNPPTNIVLTPDINEVEVTWAPSPDIDVIRYAVYAAQGTQGEATALVTDTVTLNTYTVAGLADYSDYVITVKGIDEADQYTAPLTSYVTTLSPHTPARPVITDATPDDSSVTLTWQIAGANATHYIIYLDGDSIDEVTGSLSAEVAGLNPYTFYTLAVQAVNRSDATPYKSRESLPVRVRTTDKVAPHAAPASLAQPDSTRTSVSLSWTAAEDNVGIAFYYIYWDGALLDSTRSNEPVYVRGGLPARADTSYQVYVVGVDLAGNLSGSSNVITVQTGSKADLPVWYVGTWASKPSNRVFGTFGDAQHDITQVTGDTVPSQVWIQAGTYSITATILLDNKATSYYGGFAGYESSPGERAKVPGGKGWEFVNVTTLVRAADVDVVKGSNGKDKSITGDVTIDGISFDGRNEGVNKRAIWVANVYLADGDAIKETFRVFIKNCIVEGFGQEGTGAVNGGTDGAIAIRDCDGHAYVDSCLVQSNKGNVGAGIYVADADNCDIRVVSNCYILNNETGMASTSPRPDVTTGAPANWAGGVIANMATIRSCYIAGNKAFGGGGVVFRRSGSKLENCIIAGNEATYGGGVLFHQAVTEGLITNNTIAENKASVAGGGIYVDENGQQIMNNILWQNVNTSQDNKVQNVGVLSGKTPKLSNNIISTEDSYKGTEPIVMPVTATKDTIFDGAGAGYEGWHTKLSDSSLVYDRGTLEVIGFAMPTTDYTGARRVVGGRIDIGPFEYQGNPGAPLTPGNLTVTARGETTITVSWSASSMPEGSAVTLAGYHVYVNMAESATVSAPDTTCTITGLSAWTEYTIQVDAYGSTGERSPKTAETFRAKTTDESAPSDPSNLTVSGITKNSAQLQWNPSSDNVGVTAYRIYLPGSSAPAYTTGATETSRVINYLEADTEYTIEVSAADAADNESGKTAVTFTTLKDEEDTPGQGTSVLAAQAASLRVFPNPVANGRLVIVNGELKPGAKIAIYAADGARVKEDVVSEGLQTIVNVAGVKSGIYAVRVGNRAVKIVITNRK